MATTTPPGPAAARAASSARSGSCTVRAGGPPTWRASDSSVPAGSARGFALWVFESNERARAFYRRYGFTETGGGFPYDLDPTKTELEMALLLD